VPSLLWALSLRKEASLNSQQAFDASNNLLPPSQAAGGSSSRSPSPTPHARLPAAGDIVLSPRSYNAAMPLPMPRPFGSDVRSRTPSPDSLRQPRIPPSPGRAGSPLGQSGPTKAKGPRPLPNPFSRSQNPSNRDLPAIGKEGATPSRSGTDSTDYHGQHGAGVQSVHVNGDAHEDDEDSDAPALARPSRKALGKRRVIEDPDSEPRNGQVSVVLITRRLQPRRHVWIAQVAVVGAIRRACHGCGRVP
jgi:hypothetical protein